MNKQGVRVLHYFGTNFGMTGVETFVLQLVAAQKRAGSLPSILLELDNRQAMAAAGSAMGVPVFDFPKRSALEDRLPRKLGTALLRARRVQWLIEHMRNADVLHLHSVGVAGLDALVAAAMLRTCPVVVTHHATLTWFEPMRNRMTDLTLWFERHVASYALMPYPDAAEELIARGGLSKDIVSVVPFCVDESRFEKVVAPPAPGQLTMVMSARMFPEKGHEYLLPAMAQLAPRYPGLHLVLLGDGESRPKIESEIDRLNLRHAVEVVGHVDHDRVPDLMLKGHLVVLPSAMPGETFPLCLLEGAMLGMPAIGSRWFGIPDIIVDGETGLIVEPRDVDALARAIERFLLDPSFLASAGAKARARAQAHFTSAAVARTYNELYLKALAKRQAAPSGLSATARSSA